RRRAASRLADAPSAIATASGSADPGRLPLAQAVATGAQVGNGSVVRHAPDLQPLVALALESPAERVELLWVALDAREQVGDGGYPFARDRGPSEAIVGPVDLRERSAVRGRIPRIVMREQD